MVRDGQPSPRQAILGTYDQKHVLAMNYSPARQANDGTHARIGSMQGACVLQLARKRLDPNTLPKHAHHFFVYFWSRTNNGPGLGYVLTGRSSNQVTVQGAVCTSPLQYGTGTTKLLKRSLWSCRVTQLHIVLHNLDKIGPETENIF